MEEWDPVEKKWNAIETTMKKKRAFFGVVVAPREAVCCPPKDEDWVLGNGAESCSDVCFRRGQVWSMTFVYLLKGASVKDSLRINYDLLDLGLAMYNFLTYSYI